MKKILTLTFIVAACIPAFAQLRIGSKAIHVKKAVEATSNVVNATTLTDQDIADLSREYIEWMDTHNPVAAPDTEYGQRITRLTSDIKDIEGMPVNFKVYEVIDVNAFACGDGSIRVCAGLMDVMSDDEVMAVIGHELGHVVCADVKDAIRTSYITSAAINAAGASGGVAAKLSDSELANLAQSFTEAQFSQKQENGADDFAFDFCIKHGFDKYAMANALNKLVELSNGAKSSLVQKMFSSHPDSAKRATRMKEKADAYSAK